MNFSFDRAIIGQTYGYGGLGDNWKLSTLPEMFAEQVFKNSSDMPQEAVQDAENGAGYTSCCLVRI